MFLSFFKLRWLSTQCTSVSSTHTHPINFHKSPTRDTAPRVLKCSTPSTKNSIFYCPKLSFYYTLNCCLNWWFLIKLVAGDVCCLILLLHNKNGDLNSTPTNKINVRTTVMADHIIKRRRSSNFRFTMQQSDTPGFDPSFHYLFYFVLHRQ